MNINEKLVLEAIQNVNLEKIKSPDLIMFLNLLEIGIENIVWSDYPVQVQEDLKDKLVDMLKD